MSKLKTRIAFLVLALYAGLAWVGVSHGPSDVVTAIGEAAPAAPQTLAGGDGGQGQWHSFLPGVFK